MTYVAMIGLAVQLFGAVLTGHALAGEWFGRRSRVKPPGRPRVRNPWEGSWQSKLGHVSALDRQRYQRGIAGKDHVSSLRGAGSDPELVSMAIWARDVFTEAREGLRVDWDRQNQGHEVLHAATVDLFDALQDAHSATRQRVKLEMTGLGLVIVGTVLSSF